MYRLVCVHMGLSRNGTTSRAHKEASLRDLSSDCIVGNEFRPAPVHTIFSSWQDAWTHTQHKVSSSETIYAHPRLRQEGRSRSHASRVWSHWLTLIYHDYTLILYLYILWGPSVLRIVIRCQFHDSHIFHVRGMLDDVIQNDCCNVSVHSS
jgi:hypothetical protein